MTELNFKTPSSMFDVHNPFMSESKDVVVHWKILIDDRNTHIEGRYNQIDKIEGKLQYNEDDEVFDLSKFEIINELNPNAIGIGQLVIDEEETIYVQ